MQLALGAMLKGYRLQRELDQTDVSAAMGWTNVSRLSRCEQGRVLPNREVLEQLALALGLTQEERGSLLMEAGYLPTDEEVAAAWDDVEEIVRRWSGPASLLDFAGRFVGGNAHFASLWQLTPEEVSLFARQRIYHLELLFDPALPVRQRLTEERFLAQARAMISRFKTEQRHRTKHKWHRQLLQRLMALPLFLELWHDTAAAEATVVRYYERAHGANLVHFDFHTFTSPLGKDPRFILLLRLPANEATAQRFAPFVQDSGVAVPTRGP